MLIYDDLIERLTTWAKSTPDVRAALVIGSRAQRVRPEDAWSYVRWVTAADHRDSAVLTASPAQDIADVYSFQSPSDPANLVLAMTVSGFIPPAEAATAAFDPGVLYQWKIDTNGDAVEDRVIQAFATGAPGNQVMHFVGPVSPVQTGAATRLVGGREFFSVRVSNGATPFVTSRQGIRVFAGVRDDPFFFDLVRFNAVIAGLLGLLRKEYRAADIPSWLRPLSALRSIHRQSAPFLPPATGVLRPWLFTAGRADPSLLADLRGL